MNSYFPDDKNKFVVESLGELCCPFGESPLQILGTREEYSTVCSSHVHSHTHTLLEKIN